VPTRESKDAVHAPELIPVECAESAQEQFALVGQDHSDSTGVVGVRRPLDEVLLLRSVDQFDDAVVPQLEPVGEFADHGPVASGEALERQHELVLLRSDAMTAHCLLAEAQVAPDAEAEPGERFEVLLGQGVHGLGEVLRRAV
jgi:hypothetical protein